MAELGQQTFGILLPLTSRGVGGDRCVSSAEQRVEGFMKHLLENTQLREEGSAARAKLYIGVDDGDHFSSADGKRFLEGLLQRYSIEFEVVPPFPSSFTGKICWIWRELAAHAYKEGRDFIVLLGDDVTIQTDKWMDRIERAYADLAAEIFTTKEAQVKCYGFGCICFADQNCPNFPSFPVLHRKHFQIMSEQIFPLAFKNQDADPYLFEMYKRVNASRILPDLKLVNGIGGHADARYTKIHIDWKGVLLDEAVAKIRDYLEPWEGQMTARHPSLDVIVPCYRCDLDSLRRICELNVANEGTRIIIIVDRPEKSDWVREALEKLPRVLVRANEDNLGASAARNRGMKESAAEYRLFLDDDVHPEADIILAYSTALLELGNSVDGLVGMVKFPPMRTLHQKAVFLSDVSYMFGIAKVLDTPSWGVTANLLLKNKRDIRFSLDFPKTGGGEDIDICLRGYSRSDGTPAFRSCPTAIVTHPWWDSLGHFTRWAIGDGQLLNIYPQHTYLNFPNVAESVVAAAVLTPVIWSPYTLTGIAMRMTMSSVAVIASEMLSDVIKHCIVRRTRALEEIRGLTRVVAAARSSIIILGLEYGRLWGHLNRGQLLRNFMWRFDWHCGQMPGSVRHERVVAGGKFVTHVAMVTLFQWGFTRVVSLLDRAS